MLFSRSFVIASMGCVTFILAGCGSSQGSAPVVPVIQKDTRLADAKTKCNEFDSEGTVLSVSQADASMFIDTASKDDFIGYMAYSCVAEFLKFSQPLQKSVENTSAMQGQKDWSENGLAFQWTYHPDNGLDMSIRLE